MHNFKFYDSLEEDKLYPEKCTMALMCMIRDDRVHNASEMFREWKGPKHMDKDTITPD